MKDDFVEIDTWRLADSFNLCGALEFSEKLSKASEDPDKTTCEELLSFAIKISLFFSTNRSS